FFQAEDGIRGFHVTGVQTCALPISATASLATTSRCWIWGKSSVGFSRCQRRRDCSTPTPKISKRPTPWPCCDRKWMPILARAGRSEERRVGKEGGGAWRCERQEVKA